MKKILFALSFVLYTTMGFANEILIIGCKPWDKNLENVKGLENAHFIDAYPGDIPAGNFPNFHHIDVNNEGKNGAGSLADYAKENLEKFDMIIVDYATYQHLDLATASIHLRRILKKEGQIVVPISSITTSDLASSSAASAEIAASSLNGYNFFEIKQVPYAKLPLAAGLELLTSDRGGMRDSILKNEPVFLIAMKKAKK